MGSSVRYFLVFNWMIKRHNQLFIGGIMIPIITRENFNYSRTHIHQPNITLQQTVHQIIQQVIERGDDALRELTKQFDHVNIAQFRVPESMIDQATQEISPEHRKIITNAIDNVKRFHQKQVAQSWQLDFPDGSSLGQIVQPIDRVGIYIPGGRAVYPSSVIMNAIPALIAGVLSIAVVSPPQPNGYPHPLILATCGILGLNEIYSVGGAQSIAALAYGTDSISPVYKITGPGNAYVAEAKRQVFGYVGIDSIAGPSEIVILHDNPQVPVEFIVRDLLSQAEHDPDAKTIFITCYPEIAQQVVNRLNDLVPQLPRREIIESSLKQNGTCVLISTIQQGIDLVNLMAPEHLEILVQDESISSKIRNAGAMFIGQWSSEPLGDYYAGPNHILPTNGSAMFSSALGVYDFQKYTSMINYSKNRFMHEGPNVVSFAEMEQLYAHAEAIKVRLLNHDS